MRVLQYFSDDYAGARQAFLDASDATGATVESFQNPNSGRGENQLFTDVATLGPSNAENILVLMSGTHGVEGFAGSGLQTGLLRENIAERLGPNTKLVFIHALNPYGFANLRRFNEDNVDLNRNFVDHSCPYPENRGYDQLAGALAPKSFSLAANFFSMSRLICYHLWHKNNGLQRVVTQGQYSHPKGLFYGGRFPSWSNLTLHKIAEHSLAGGKHVVVIDFHTGLGPYGHGEVILNYAEDDPAYHRAVEWWGKERVKSTMKGDSVSAHLSGTAMFTLTEILPDAEVTAVALEIGTLPPMTVFKAIRAENWLTHHGGGDHRSAARIKLQLLRAFYPDDDNWKRKVWEQGREIVDQALTHF